MERVRADSRASHGSEKSVIGESNIWNEGRASSPFTSDQRNKLVGHGDKRVMDLRDEIHLHSNSPITSDFTSSHSHSRDSMDFYPSPNMQQQFSQPPMQQQPTLPSQPPNATYASSHLPPPPQQSFQIDIHQVGPSSGFMWCWNVPGVGSPPMPSQQQQTVSNMRNDDVIV